TIPAMLAAGKKANQCGRPVLLDPVGAGASPLRTQTAGQLLDQVSFTAIRGNVSEIKALSLGSATTRGVDADLADAITED
ncbi:hydroxyethylthiazole kinase, partial [Pseudomonas aeruginosa]|nr:hydroxyethylthiazole kinase [Pseudomonas aeruginosa]